MTDRAIKKPVKRTAAQKKNPGGRKAVVTAATLQKLEEAFALGCTDLEACFYADIGKSTLYNYQDANPKFLERKEALKQRPVYLARKVVVDALLDNDRGIADKLLTRRDGSKQILAGDPDSPLQINVVERRIVRSNAAN
jgi:hypothetical protein